MRDRINKLKRSTSFRKVLYEWALPAVAIVSLLIISGRVRRPVFLNSDLLDFLIRIWVSLMFVAIYLICYDANRYIAWYYGGKRKDPDRPLDNVTILWNGIVSILLGAFAMLISYWSLQTFFSISGDIALLLSSLNGVLIAAPIFSDRERIRL